MAALLLLVGVALGGAPQESIAAVPAGPVAAGRPALLPALPPAQPENGVRMDLVSLTPEALAPGGTATAQVAVTNASTTPIAAPRLALTSPAARVTSRDALEDWQSDTTVSTARPVGAGAPDPTPLAPGETRTFTVSATAADLGYADSPELWGARRVALTVLSGDAPLATLRTFLVWRPAGATDAITQSVLLPISATDSGLAAMDPAAYDASVTSGRLSGIGRIAARPDVDWLLDPSVVDPPVHGPPATAPSDDPAADGGTPAPDASTAAQPADASSAPPSEAPSANPSPAAPSSATSGPAQSPGAAAFAQQLIAAAPGRTILTSPFARADVVSLHTAGTSDLLTALDARSTQALQTAGITSCGMALAVDGASADPTSLAAVQAVGPAAIITSAAGLRRDPHASVTPSSAGTLVNGGQRTPVLAPDPVLTDELAALDGSADAQQTTQRLLAETAVIASEPTTAPRHLLAMLPSDTALDPSAVSETLDAIDAAPWVHHGSTADLQALATSPDAVQDSQDTTGAPLTLGEVPGDRVRPSGRDDDGRVTHLASPVDAPLLDADLMARSQRDLERVTALRSIMEEPRLGDDAFLTVVSSTSETWREDPDALRARAEAAGAATDGLAGHVTVQPASSYTLVASGSSVPIAVTNTLDTPVHATVSVTVDHPLVRLPGRATTVEVPAHGRVTAAVPVEAVANGRVTLDVSLTNEDGAVISGPRHVALAVSPSWENWITMILVVLMGILVVVGVLRARRHGSDRRAPGMRGPEDPSTLARTGLSAPACEGPEPDPDPDAPRPPHDPANAPAHDPANG